MAPEWLSQSVVYQIYPQSFLDTSGDGIGDIKGIISKLDYVQSLGASVIWLNPCFDSPFSDAGYDVRDYVKVAPRYGTNSDLIDLFEEAGRRNMRILLDLVAGHTSVEHPWIQNSAQGANNEYSDRYIWKNRDFDPDEGPTADNHVPNYFDFQPALNFGYARPTESWHDPIDAPGPLKNRQALKDIMAFWMDLGCSGFRVDMAPSLIKNDTGFQENSRLWREMRRWFDEHYPECILVAEWSNPAESIPAGFHLDFMMQFHVDVYRSLFFNETGTKTYDDGPCYFDQEGAGTPFIFMNEYLKQLEAVKGKGFISLPTANHDFQRLRCGSRDWEGLRPAWVFLMTQPGIPTIYYGDEIGMRFVEDTPPKEGSTLFNPPPSGTRPGHRERAGTRTPMQWDSSLNAGFSAAAADALYLPLDPHPDRPSVEAQESDQESLLNFVRKLVRLRKEHPALGAEGELLFLNREGDNYPLACLRRHQDQSFLVTVNPSGRRVTCEYSCSAFATTDILNDGVSADCDGSQLRLDVAPFGYGILELSGAPR